MRAVVQQCECRGDVLRRIARRAQVLVGSERVIATNQDDRADAGRILGRAHDAGRQRLAAHLDEGRRLAAQLCRGAEARLMCCQHYRANVAFAHCVSPSNSVIVGFQPISFSTWS